MSDVFMIQRVPVRRFGRLIAVIRALLSDCPGPPGSAKWRLVRVRNGGNDETLYETEEFNPATADAYEAAQERATFNCVEWLRNHYPDVKTVRAIRGANAVIRFNDGKEVGNIVDLPVSEVNRT